MLISIMHLFYCTGLQTKPRNMIQVAVSFIEPPIQPSSRLQERKESGVEDSESAEDSSNSSMSRSADDSSISRDRRA
jgi:hypothetical protein